MLTAMRSATAEMSYLSAVRDMLGYHQSYAAGGWRNRWNTFSRRSFVKARPVAVRLVIYEATSQVSRAKYGLSRSCAAASDVSRRCPSCVLKNSRVSRSVTRRIRTLS